MNREILFRGKRVDNGEWVQGSLLSFDYGGKTILPSTAKVFKQSGTTTICCNECHDVDPTTVGQYTGLTDKNGVKIFEGDIISYNGSKGTVRFDTSLNIPCFTTGIGGGSSTGPHPYKISKRHVVIGNIHDNPELLGGNA